MKTININKQEGVELILFPDNQPHVRLQGIEIGDEVNVVVSLKDSITVLNLLQVSNALDHLFCKKKTLTIKYLMGARSDRVMVEGDSVDIQVITTLINFCNFEKVITYDVHSDVSSMLLNKSVNISNRLLVEAYKTPESVLIVPDAGAVKKVGKYLEWNKNIIDVVYCIKDRDLSTGKITLKVLEPEKCFNKNCVVIDDLCDAGGTFLGIASQIKPSYLTLVVTHGLFTKGLSELEKYYNYIITSDSYHTSYNSPKVKIVKLHLQ